MAQRQLFNGEDTWASIQKCQIFILKYVFLSYTGVLIAGFGIHTARIVCKCVYVYIKIFTCFWVVVEL